MKYYIRKNADCFASKNKFSLAEIEGRLLAGEIDPSWEACEDGRRIWQAISKLTSVEPPATPEGIQYEAHNPPQDAVCYLLRDGQQHGPYTPTQIRTMWAAGQITVDTLYWFEGLSDWFQVANFANRMLIHPLAPCRLHCLHSGLDRLSRFSESRSLHFSFLPMIHL